MSPIDRLIVTLDVPVNHDAFRLYAALATRAGVKNFKLRGRAFWSQDGYELAELIERLKAATEGSRELDAEIFRVVTKEPTPDQQVEAFRLEFNREPSSAFREVCEDSWKQALANPPRYTRDVAVAPSLDPDPAGSTWNASKWLNGSEPGGVVYWCDLHLVSGASIAIRHRCLPLAICVAFLTGRKTSVVDHTVSW